MAAEVPPGRPGNLSTEQEEKLRKFWELLLHLSGPLDEEKVADDATASNGTAEGSTREANNVRPVTASSEKPKKKKLSLFGKKKKDKEGEGETVTAPAGLESIANTDAEDKWGQNKEFQEILTKHSGESLRTKVWSMVKHDHPDALLLRFLRARKWDVNKALVMLVSTINWRAHEMHVDDDIMKNGEAAAAEGESSSDEKIKREGHDFLEQMRLGKSFLHGVDKQGRPMCFVRVRLHRQGEQTEQSLERYTVWIIETARFFLKPPVDTATIVFDMTGFSMANMDYTPVKFMIKCFEANYPESLGAVLVHKAPWVFQGIWKIIRGWLDPVVASKVHFTNNRKEFEEFVAPNRIPKELGGDEEWEYKYVEPVPGENDLMKDTDTRGKYLAERQSLVREFETITKQWVSTSDVEKIASLKLQRNDLVARLREDYWRLDPYVRARSYYERIGVLSADGNLDPYPAVKPVTPVAAVETSADDVD